MKAKFHILFCLLVLGACKKEYDGIPEVWIDIRISTQDTRYQMLTAVNGVAFIDKVGVAGIVVVNTGNRFRAFERCSTVEPEKRCAVELDETNVGLIDPCSGARYSLTDGAPTKAPAKIGLKEYRVSVTGNVIHIYN